MTPLITRSELETAITEQNVTVIDALPASYFAQQHLPGAVNLVADEVQQRAETLLPYRDALIVVYCSNRACPNSGHVATKLEKLGYRNIRKYAEGIRDWVSAGLPTESSLAPTVTRS